MKKLLTILLLGLAFTNNINANNEENQSLSKTDEVLAKAAEKAINLAEKTGQFVVGQAPDLLKEFYNWHIYSDIFWIVFGIIIFLLARYLPYLWLGEKDPGGYTYRYFGNRYDDDAVVATWIFYSALTLISSLMLLINIYDLIYLLVSPKLYLIDYFIK